MLPWPARPLCRQEELGQNCWDGSIVDASGNWMGVYLEDIRRTRFLEPRPLSRLLVVLPPSPEGQQKPEQIFRASCAWFVPRRVQVSVEPRRECGPDVVGVAGGGQGEE